MRASYTLVALASAVPLLLAAGTASAHLNLVSPPPRLEGQAGGNQLKTKPCGQMTNMRTDKVTTFTPGQKVDIKIKEYVDHPGYFAVAFDPDGDDNFPFPRANMDDVDAATDDPKALFPISNTVLGIRTDKEKECYTENAQHECTISVTIPNMTCQNCTLQVTQFMTDKLGDGNDNEYYYQCADIKIEGTVMGGSGGSGGMGGMAAVAGGGAGVAAAGGAGAGGVATGNGGGAIGGSSAISGGMPGTAGTLATSAGTTASGGGSGVTNPGGGGAPDDGGCGIAKRAQGPGAALALLGVLLALGRRRGSK
jgi:hypothetical protein